MRETAIYSSTSCAAEEHSYRVFHQVQQWNEKTLDPTAWGWKLKKGHYFPVTTIKAIAPKDLLDNVSSKCAKSGCDKACSCRKANLPYGAACFKCQDNCTNQMADN